MTIHRRPMFMRFEDRWIVRGPRELLEDRDVVTVRKADGKLVDVEVDRRTLRPLPRNRRTQWDGRDPHTIELLHFDDQDV